MSHAEQILATAQTRQTEQKLPYFGALTPQEALALLQIRTDAKLIDVRTQAELDWVGTPLVPGDQYQSIEWIRYPGGAINTEFLQDLAHVADPSSDTPLLFICRSAVRSKQAARLATEAGYRIAIDVLEGFEGNKDAQGHRRTVEGWCFRGLPWKGA